MRITYIILTFICTSTAAFSQNTRNQRVDTIPFVLTSHNNIVIETVVNKTDTVQLMFHTASGSVTLTEECSEKITSVTWRKGPQLNSWGGSSASRVSNTNSISIHGLRWDSVTLWADQKSGPLSDGKFGPNLFRDRSIQFDFERNILLIGVELPADSLKFTQHTLVTKNGEMYIEGICEIDGIAYPNQYLIHSGYGGDILLADAFTVSGNLGEKIKIVEEQDLKDSFGNSIKVKKGILPTFRLGKQTLVNLPVGFFEGTIGQQSKSILGGDIIKRFDIVISEDRKYIYLKPNSLFTAPSTRF
jgi:hypothetical protein